MSYMLACQANDVFRAIAPVAGCMMEEIYNTCDSSPVPVLEIHEDVLHYGVSELYFQPHIFLI